MSIHLLRDIDKLKRAILSMGAEVETDFRTAIRSIEDRDADLAEQVLKREPHVNALEVDIEEECLKVLALYQPVASDLRYVIAVLKINQDLERIGDLAVHIAERSLALCDQPRLDAVFPLGEMADKAQGMLKKILDAFVALDAADAREVCLADSAVDALNRDIFMMVKAEVARHPASFETLLQIMSIARHLERIADHATNIAEDLIYLIEGRIVRHTAEVSDKSKQA
jgi:phosphate transport system protein